MNADAVPTVLFGRIILDVRGLVSLSLNRSYLDSRVVDAELVAEEFSTPI